MEKRQLVDPARETPQSPPESAAATAFAAPIIPDHTLIKQIGRGSYGAVWLARNATGSYRAVKVVYRASFEADKPFDREFNGIKEFEPISRLHQSQIGILHVGRNDPSGCFFYVLELADDASSTGPHQRSTPGSAGLGCEAPSPTAGTVRIIPRIDPESYEPATLRTLLSRHIRLPVGQCVEIALGLAEALENLHAHGLVHRDIKPSNIIFVNGRPKLADIGLVARADATQSFVGTEGYLPPEGPGKPQADIFALGMVLYETATGLDRRRFPEPPSDVRELPERKAFQEFNEVILKCCEPEATRRYTSATELVRDLQSLAAGRSVRWRHVRGRWFTRKPRATLWVLPLLVLGGLLLQRACQPGRHETVRIARPVPIMGMDGTRLVVDPRAPRNFDASPDGSQIVFEDGGRLFVFDRLTRISRPLFEKELETWLLSVPRWAPDGQRLAFARRKKGEPDSGISFGIVVAETTGGESVQVLHSKLEGPVMELVWKPDGSALTGRIEGRPVFDLSMAGERHMWPMDQFQGPPLRLGNYTADGKWQVIVVRGTAVAIVGSQDEPPMVVADFGLPVFHPAILPDGSAIYIAVMTSADDNKWRLDRIRLNPKTGRAQGKPETLQAASTSQIAFPLVVGEGKELVFLMRERIRRVYRADYPGLKAKTQVAEGHDPIPSPNGETIYFVNPESGERGVYAVSSGDTRPRLIVTNDQLRPNGFGGSIDLSPDGKTLAFATHDGNTLRIFTVATNGLALREIFSGTATRSTPPRWSPKGDQIAFSVDDQQIYLVGPNGAGLELLVDCVNAPDGSFFMKWSPTGDYLAYIGPEPAKLPGNTPRSASHSVWGVFAVSLSNREIRRLNPPEESGADEWLSWHPSGLFLTYFRYGPGSNTLNHELRRAYLDGSPSDLMINEPDHHEYWGVWGSEGRYFYFNSWTGLSPSGQSHQGPHVFDRETGIIEHQAPLPSNAKWSHDGKTVTWVGTEGVNQLWSMAIE